GNVTLSKVGTRTITATNGTAIGQDTVVVEEGPGELTLIGQFHMDSMAVNEKHLEFVNYNGQKMLFTVNCGSGSDPRSVLFKYDLATRQATEINIPGVDIRSTDPNFEYVPALKKIFFIADQSNVDYPKELWSYDIETGEFTKLSQNVRGFYGCRFSMVFWQEQSSQDKLLFYFGHQENTYTETGKINYFSLSDNIWHGNVARLPDNQDAEFKCFYRPTNDRIYAIGGWENHGTAYRDISVYDPNNPTDNAVGLDIGTDEDIKSIDDVIYDPISDGAYFTRRSDNGIHKFDFATNEIVPNIVKTPYPEETVLSLAFDETNRVIYIWDCTGKKDWNVYEYKLPGHGNTPPDAVDDTATVNEDSSGNVIDVLANDNDPDGDSLTIQSVTDPPHGVARIAGDHIEYTPDPDYPNPEDSGQDSFQYTISDGNGGTDTATVTVTVNNVNDPPVAQDQSVNTDEDTPVDITLVATDADGDSLTYAIVTQPSHGTLTGTPPNVTYTPDANYNGPDSFTFKANDGKTDSNIATVSITVNPVNDPPTQPASVLINNGAETADDDENLVCTVEGSEDPDGDTVQYIYHWTSTGGDDITHGPRPETQDTIDASQTSPSEVWTCEVTPTDGEDNGIPKTSENTVTIQGWVDYIPTSEQTEIIIWTDNQGITHAKVIINFPDGSYGVEDWGEVESDGNIFWVDAKVKQWRGGVVPQVVNTVEHTYDLGTLSLGDYTVIFKAWGEEVESRDFQISNGWEVLLNVELNGSPYSTLVFGMQEGATDNFDAGIDQIAPPASPDGDDVCLSSITGEASPYDRLLIDKRGITDTLTIWRLKVKIANGKSTKISWDSGNLPQDITLTWQEADENWEGVGDINDMRETGEINITNDTGNLLTKRYLIRASSTTLFNLHLEAGGWNLISLPINPTNTSPQEVFGANLIAIYRWDAQSQRYVIPEEIKAKEGYWVAVSESVDLEIEGMPPENSSVNVLPGWNLIGPVGNQDIPQESFILAVFGWDWPPNYRYIIPESCEEGKGYWVASTEEGEIW
ncbi:MAG: hypothetical protein DRP73_03945, partial [Candidatus Omnitrophota bacterium]